MTFEGFSVLGAIVFGFLFGFGFAVAGSLWGALLSLRNRQA